MRKDRQKAKIMSLAKSIKVENKNKIGELQVTEKKSTQMAPVIKEEHEEDGHSRTEVKSEMKKLDGTESVLGMLN